MVNPHKPAGSMEAWERCLTPALESCVVMVNASFLPFLFPPVSSSPNLYLCFLLSVSVSLSLSPCVCLSLRLCLSVSGQPVLVSSSSNM